MADRIAVMHRGVIRRLGTPEEVYDHPGDCFTAKFLGDVNFIPGDLGADGVFHCALGNIPAVAGNTPPGPAVGAIRPERIRFAAPGGDGFPARIVGRTFLGESCEWEAAAGELKLVVREGAAPARAIGDAVALNFEPGYFTALPKEGDDE